jgi:hypothetical protein
MHLDALLRKVNAGHSTGEHKPLQAAGLAGSEGDTQHTSPAMTEEMEARPIAQFQMVDKVIQLSDE